MCIVVILIEDPHHHKSISDTNSSKHMQSISLKQCRSAGRYNLHYFTNPSGRLALPKHL
ncbi:hypothetical protein LINPERHAP1_LOCUS10616 [Linum perenne]